MTTKSGNQCSSVQKRIRDVSEQQQWLINVFEALICKMPLSKELGGPYI